MRQRRFADLCLLLLALLWVSLRPVPASGQQPVEPPLPPPIGQNAYGTLRDPAFTALLGATARWGQYDGGVYRIEVPDQWNGGLALLLHGYRGEGTDIYLEMSPIRQTIIASGYAWAASSYRANGYRPDFAVEDTLALRDLFTEQIGPPRLTLLEGQSMGGHALITLLEQYPEQFQGGLAVCGVLDGVSQLDYLAAYTALADLLSGVPLLDTLNPALFTRAVQDEWLPALGRPGALTDKGRAFYDVISRWLGPELAGLEAGLAATWTMNLQPPLFFPLDGNHGLTPAVRSLDTRGLRFTIAPEFGLSDDELNAAVRRYRPAADGRNAGAIPAFAEFSGRLSAPVLSIHTTGDAFVPFRLEQDYLRRAVAAGRADLLVQRAIRRPSHCAIRNAEYTAAFRDLVGWVEQGERPEGDDLLGGDPAAFGLRWTVGR